MYVRSSWSSETPDEWEGLDEVVWVRLDDFIFEDAYQRPLIMTRVKKIVDEFDRSAIGILEVAALPNGKYAGLDGQHRHAALKIKGFIYAPCHVHRGLELWQRSYLFNALNGNRNQLSVGDKLRAATSSGDELTAEWVRVLAKHNYSFYLGTSEKGRGPREVRPGIKSYFINNFGGEEGGLEMVDLVLGLLNKYAPETKTTTLSIHLKGFAHFLYHESAGFSEDLSEDIIARILDNYTVDKVKVDANLYMSRVMVNADAAHDRSQATAFRRVYSNLYHGRHPIFGDEAPDGSCRLV